MRIYKLLLIVVLASLVTWLCGCEKVEIKNINSTGKNIICFGDSLTFGYGANQGEDYPAALAKLTGIAVINAGKDADTTYEALKRIELDVLNKEPRLVIIEFCGNDFLKKIPIKTTVENIRKMIAEIQAKGAMVAIVDVGAGLFLEEYRAAFKKLSRQTSSIFVPKVMEGIITNPSMKSDFLHPNGNGYQIIAQRIYLILKRRLRLQFSLNLLSLVS